jgi:hypothetical protein
MVGVFMDGPHAGRLRVHGPCRFGRGTQAEWQGTLVYAIPPRSCGARGGEAYGCPWRRWRHALPGWWASCRSMMADQAVLHDSYARQDTANAHLNESLAERVRAALARKRH